MDNNEDSLDGCGSAELSDVSGQTLNRAWPNMRSTCQSASPRTCEWPDIEEGMAKYEVNMSVSISKDVAAITSLGDRSIIGVWFFLMGSNSSILS